MKVVINMEFDTPGEYTAWLQQQAMLVSMAGGGGEEKLKFDLSTNVDHDDESDTETTVTERVTPETGEVEPEPTQPDNPGKKAPRKRRPRKTAAQKKVEAEHAQPPVAAPKDVEGAAVVEDPLPTAPVAEAAPAPGETVLTLADSRTILINYLAKEGNSSATLLEELGKQGAKRINEVAPENVHGFLTRMVAQS